MVLASQVCSAFYTRKTHDARQDNVEIPFVAQLYTTAYDWVGKTDAVSQSDIADILHASGFNGRIISYDAANHTLLIENDGVLKAAIATSVDVEITCWPIKVRAVQQCLSIRSSCCIHLNPTIILLYTMFIRTTGPRAKLPPAAPCGRAQPCQQPCTACTEHGRARRGEERPSTSPERNGGGRPCGQQRCDLQAAAAEQKTRVMLLLRAEHHQPSDCLCSFQVAPQDAAATSVCELPKHDVTCLLCDCMQRTSTCSVRHVFTSFAHVII